MRHIAVSSALVLALGLISCSSVEPITSCDPVGAATPLCGFQNPEDLALLPDRRHVLVSEYGDAGARPGRISLLDLESNEHTSLFAGGEPAGPGPWGAPDCEGPPSTAFSPHGIHLAKRADGLLQLLVVQHGGRESVEMFEVTQDEDAGWGLAWRGCAVAPDGGLNDVVALPEGGFLATRFAPTGRLAMMLVFAKAWLFGGDTGWVYAWNREAGFSEVPGTRAAGPNGIELSADGEKIFLNATLASDVRRIDRRTGAIEARAAVKQPDNLTWTRDGRLLVASLRGAAREMLSCNGVEGGSCPMPFAIVALDPNTMETETLYEGGPGTPSGAGTVGLEVDGALLIGTFAGDRILRVETESVRW
jgi:hypothetical protein